MSSSDKPWANQMEVVGKVAEVITSNLDIDQIYEQFAVQVKQLVEFDRISISLIDQTNDEILIAYLSRQNGSHLGQGELLPLRGSPAELVTEAGKTIIVQDMTTDNRFPEAYLAKDGLRSGIMVPLVSKDTVIAVFSVFSQHPHAYGESEQILLERLSPYITSAIENTNQYQETERIALAMESIGDGVIFLDSAGNIQFANKATEEIYGYTAAELLGQPYTIFSSPADPSRQEVGRKILQTALGVGWKGEVRKRRKNGDEFDAHLTVTPVKDHRGTTIGIVSTVQDITETKNAEAEIRRLNQFNHRIISSAPLPLMVLRGEDHVVASVNPAFCQSFGVVEEFIVGKPISAVVKSEQLEKIVENTFSGHQTNAHGELHYTPAEGPERWFVVSTAQLGETDSLSHQACPEALFVLNDITEEKEHQVRLHETARLAAIGELAAGVAHEINNPLTIIMGFSELLLGEDLPPQIHDEVTKIYENSRRAEKVVQNLLSFARKHDPEIQICDIVDIVKKVFEFKSVDFVLGNIQVSTQLPDKSLNTLADEHQIMQVLLNLLTNAEQAMLEVSEGGSLKLSIGEVKGMIRISVSDSGPGISPEHLNRVFDPFFSTKGVGKGTGLGLSICYGIVTQHGGDMWVESTQGEGAIFYVELPLVAADVPRAVDYPQSGFYLPSVSSGKQILVVDDEQDIREMLAEILESDGHRVDIASDGREAWECLNRDTYDLVFLDMRMPGMNGRQFYSLL